MLKVMRERLEKKTRRIFHAIHESQRTSKLISNRLLGLYSAEYFRVPPDFFRDGVCLDAGCGSNAHAARKLLMMGAKKVYALDLDKTFVKTAGRSLENFKGRYQLDVGNILGLKYDSNFFDFTLCAGVLHHIANPWLGLKELARVTKAGGVLYVEVYGEGGLIRQITKILRDQYTEDIGFKRTIDRLKPKDFLLVYDWIVSKMKARGDPYWKRVPRKIINKLFDEDLVLTIKDRIQAPIYQEISYADLVSWLKGNGFINIMRLTRYPRFRNVRRFLSPFYSEFDHDFSRFLYGDGNFQIRATKQKKAK